MYRIRTMPGMQLIKNGCAAAMMRVLADPTQCPRATTTTLNRQAARAAAGAVGEAGVCGGGPGEAARRPLSAHDSTPTMDIMGVRQDGEWAA